MHRGVRPLTLAYKGESITVDMPGWYCDRSEESVHTGEDMKVSDRALNRLKARVEGLLGPEEIRRVRKRLGLTQVVIAGVSTSSGVESTARQAYEHGFNVTLAIDAMTDVSAETHTNSVTRIFPKLGETGTTRDIVDLINKRSA